MFERTIHPLTRASATLLLALVFCFASSLNAQAPAPHQPPQGSAAIELSIVDPSGYMGSISYDGIYVLALYLPEDFIPFDEFTQGQWSHIFNRFVVGDEGKPTGTEVWLHGKQPEFAAEPAILVSPTTSRETMVEIKREPLIEERGVIVNIPNLQLGRRIAVACYSDGVWWPSVREFYFERDGEVDQTTIRLHKISHEDAPLEITSYNIEAKSLMEAEHQRRDLRWHKIAWREVIEITNPSASHAVLPRNALLAEGAEEFISIPLTPPPGVKPVQLYTDLATQWDWFVGVRSDTPIEYQGYDDQLTPYRPWSTGMLWDQGAQEGSNPHGSMHGGAEPGYKYRGAKRAGAEAHPLNLAGFFDLYGAGDVYLRLLDDQLRLVFNKPIPPATTLHIEILQHPGFAYDDPMPIEIDRLGFAYPVTNMRIVHDQGLVLSATGLQLESRGPENDGMVRPSVVKDPAKRYTMEGGKPFLFSVAASSGLQEAIEMVPAPVEPADTSESGGAGLLGAALPAEEEASGLVWQNVFILGAVIFGLLFAGALISWLRLDRDDQLHVLRSIPVSRKELLAELARLEEDLERRRIPPTAYLVERNRLFSRLVELEAIGANDAHRQLDKIKQKNAKKKQ